jgi:hypothetical protein
MDAPPPKPRARRRHFAGERQEAARLGMPAEALAAFRAHRGNALRRRIAFHLDLPAWWAWWQTDGRWERRGRRHDALCMARRDHSSPYTLDNIKPLTVAENSAETCRRKLSAAARAARARRHANGDFGHLGPGEHHPSSRSIVTSFGLFPSEGSAPT